MPSPWLAGLVALSLAGCAAPRVAPRAGLSGPGTWVKVFEDLTGTTAITSFAFMGGAWDPVRNRMYIPQAAAGPAGEMVMWEWHSPTNAWTKTLAPGPNATGINTHNCSFNYDQTHDRVWMSGCAPFANPGQWYWSPATKAWTLFSSTVPPLSTDPGMVWDATTAHGYLVGGWYGDAWTVWRQPTNPPGAWVLHKPAWNQGVDGPIIYDVAVCGDCGNFRESNLRSGWDATLQQIWFVDARADVWYYNPATTTWSKRPATGPKPPNVTVFGIDDDARRLVGWAGQDDQTTPVTVYQATYLFDLTTNTWTLGPTGAAGPPLALNMASHWAFWDTHRRDPVWLINVGYVSELWAFQSSGPPPPEAPPAPASGVQIQFTPTIPPPTTEPMPLPLRQWVGVPMPPLDQAPWPVHGETKHLRLAHNPQDGRIYFGGGDMTSMSGGTSQNSIWSYDVRTNHWRLEWPAMAPPYCGPAGMVQANTPDEVTWVWDSSRRVFWLWHGLEGVIAQRNQPCAGTGATLKAGVLRFDPTQPLAQKWTVVQDSGMTSDWINGTSMFGTYDPVTDSILTFGNGGGLTLHLPTMARTPIAMPGFTTEAGIAHGGPHLKTEYVAFDPVDRVIYAVAPIPYYTPDLAGYKRRLWRYALDTDTWTRLADPPASVPVGGTDVINVFWDSVNRVLLWPDYPDHRGWPLQLYIYHPDTNTWEVDAMAQPAGQTLLLRGNGGVFDPAQNVLVFGGSVFNEGAVPNQTHFFLYRYGAGPGVAVTGWPRQRRPP